MQPERVVIIGGGFSGAMMAINLARFGGPKATIVERRGVFGPGVAFGGRNYGQVLNVRSSNMSAYPDDPCHFERWLSDRGLASDGFALRTDYGRYLADEIDAVSTERPGRIERIAEEAVEARRSDDRWIIRCDGGTTLHADVMVLASGLAAPAVPPGIPQDVVASHRFVSDPWRDDVLASGFKTSRVLLIGTGLTMVDIALLLANNWPDAHLHALSRRGMVPQPHGSAHPASRLGEAPPAEVRPLVRWVRNAVDEYGWRAAIDRMRPYTQTIWQRFSPSDRRRFMVHLRPFWDVHRHRMAPELAERIDALQSDGRLAIHAGRLEAARLVRDGVAVSWQPRGTAARVVDTFDLVVNCTGPAPIDARNAGPLMAGLLEEKLVLRHPTGLGIEVDDQSRAIGSVGSADPAIYALGALTRGRFWEISAVPDIRLQAWNLARKLSNAHWVGGEGL